jgi:hypothetical protein
MPRISQEKEVLNILNKVQERLEEKADNNEISEGAFLEFCNHNREIYEAIEPLSFQIIHLLQRNKNLEAENMFLKLAIMEIKQTRWFKKHTDDPDYVRRCHYTRKYKMENPDRFRRCECGDWISRKTEYWEQHRKTEKCRSNRIRILYEKGKLRFNMGLDRLLLLDNTMRLNVEYDNPYHKQIECLESLIRKYKYNRRMYKNISYFKGIWTKYYPDGEEFRPKYRRVIYVNCD